MDGLNRVQLMGNLGADPDLRFGQGPDTAVLKIRIATTESFFNKSRGERQERTDWHNVTVFGKRAEALQKILKKGDPIYVEGRNQTDSYDKDGVTHYRTEVIANRITLLGQRRDGAASGAHDHDDEEEEEQPQRQPPQRRNAASGGRR